MALVFAPHDAFQTDGCPGAVLRLPRAYFPLAVWQARLTHKAVSEKTRGYKSLKTEAELAQQIRALEERLLDPEVRANAEELEELLAEDFLEFGSSGRIRNKQQVIRSLKREPATGFSLRDFHARYIGPEAALATYRVIVEAGLHEPSRSSLRSSIWVHRSGCWRLTFHQGTPLRE